MNNSDLFLQKIIWNLDRQIPRKKIVKIIEKYPISALYEISNKPQKCKKDEKW